MMNKIKVALMQMNIQWANPKANRDHAESLLAKLETNPDLVILPEMFATGFSMDPISHSEEMNGETVAWMKAISLLKSFAICGSLIIKEENKYYNRMLWVEEGEVKCTYDKRHLFRMTGEHEVYDQGAEMPIVNFKGWRVALQICYDLRFPVWSRNKVDQDGHYQYDLLIYVANWPSKRASHWRTLLPARAIENQAFVVGVNRIGQDENGFEFNGDSGIYDPLANVLAHKAAKEAILFAELDPKPMISFREKFPVWRDSDEFEIKT